MQIEERKRGSLRPAHYQIKSTLEAFIVRDGPPRRALDAGQRRYVGPGRGIRGHQLRFPALSPSVTSCDELLDNRRDLRQSDLRLDEWPEGP